MHMHQRSLLQTVAIWAGLAVFGVFLGLFVYPFGFLAIAAVVAGWMIFWVVMHQITQRLGWRTVLKQTILFLVGVLLALLLSLNHTLTDLINPLIYPLGAENPSAVIFFSVLCLWSALYGLLTRSVHGMYVALHLFNWFFWLCILSVFGLWTSGPLFLLIPLGIMLLLLGFSRQIIRNLEFLPLVQKSGRSDPAPKSDNPRDYERGYRPVYREGGNTYTMAPDEMDVSTASHSQADMQQHQ